MTPSLSTTWANILDGAVIVLVTAFIIGRAGLDAWWLLIPGFLVGYAYNAGRRRAAAERDAHHAEFLLSALRDGSDVTWNVVHSDAPKKGGRG
jgi:hypothetical protein